MLIKTTKFKILNYYNFNNYKMDVKDDQEDINEYEAIITSRDVNGAGRVRVVRVVAPMYPTHWINIHPVSVLISVIRVLAYFFHIRGYPRDLQKYLTIISAWINKSTFSD